MTRGFRLSALLRARQAQEDMAKTMVSRSRVARDEARRAVGDREAALHATSPPPAGTARAVVAAIAAQQAMAAGLAAARQTAAASQLRHDMSLDELHATARRRRSVERLAERHATEVELADRAADQRAIDEIAGRMRAEGGLA